MKSLIIGFIATLTIFLTYSDEVCGQRLDQKCRGFSLDEVRQLQCGEQFVFQGFTRYSDNDASTVKRGEFPWSAVLMKRNVKDRTKWKYLCGGTLINSNTLLTAASCLQHKGSIISLKAENIKILLGVYNISDTTEPCRKEADVETIRIHDGWNSNDDQFSFADDIALLKLKDKVDYNQMIFPICLKSSSEISNIRTGTVAKFGEFNGTRFVTSEVPVKVELSIFKTDDWLNSKHRKLAIAAWEESFVAGSETAGVCPGDTGSGFYVKSNGKFYLRGIVSSSYIDGDYNCTHNNFALYTNVLKYLDNFILKK